MEKIYKKMNAIGTSNLVLGICTIVFGVGVGIVMIINGARILASKKNITF